MAIEYEITQEGRRVRVSAWGHDESLEEVQRYGLAVIQACVDHRATAVLCDERRLAYGLSVTELYRLAEFLAERAPTVGRAAVVCDARYLPQAAFWETTCVNRGLFVRVFTSLEQAECWLETPPTSVAFKRTNRPRTADLSGTTLEPSHLTQGLESLLDGAGVDPP